MLPAWSGCLWVRITLPMSVHAEAERRHRRRDRALAAGDAGVDDRPFPVADEEVGRDEPEVHPRPGDPARRTAAPPAEPDRPATGRPRPTRPRSAPEDGGPPDGGPDGVADDDQAAALGVTLGAQPARPRTATAKAPRPRSARNRRREIGEPVMPGDGTRRRRFRPARRQAMRSAMIRGCLPFPADATDLTRLLVVSDLRRAVAWYRDVLGADVVGEYGGTSAVLRFVGSWLLLVTGGGPTADKPTVTMAAPADPDSASAELIVAVPDCRAAHAELVGQGSRRSSPTPSSTRGRSGPSSAIRTATCSRSASARPRRRGDRRGRRAPRASGRHGDGPRRRGPRRRHGPALRPGPGRGHGPPHGRRLRRRGPGAPPPSRGRRLRRRATPPGVRRAGPEVLSWIEGDVPLPPYPAWSMTDRALEDLGALVRRFHEAAASFVPPDGAAWAADWADPTGGAGDAHPDDHPQRPLPRERRLPRRPGRGLDRLRDGRPGPSALGRRDRGRDVGPARRPGPARSAPAGPRRDRPDRVLGRGYGLERAAAEELVDVLVEERAHSIANIRAEIAAGNELWIGNWAAAGGDERAAADDAWIAGPPLGR